MAKSKLTAHIDLTPDDVTEAVKAYVQAKFGYTVECVSYNIRKHSVGFGQMERDEIVFEGATCTADLPACNVEDKAL